MKLWELIQCEGYKSVSIVSLRDLMDFYCTFHKVPLQQSSILMNTVYSIDPFHQRHKLVHNGGFSKFEALCCILNVVNLNEIS